jgi:hypothetical protein
MELVQQKSYTYCCGQACVAMVSGISLSESISAFGHKNRTNYKSLINALLELGVYSETEWTEIKPRESYELTRVCIIRIVKARKRSGHFIVHHEGRFYDPSRGAFENEEALFARYVAYRIQSYLPIYSEV